MRERRQSINPHKHREAMTRDQACALSFAAGILLCMVMEMIGRAL